MSQNSPPSAPQYMSYTDNPLRPNLRYWFSPILMVDYLQNYNMDSNVSNYYFMQPGDSYEAPIYTAKQAYVAAVNTMQTNHPNDWVTVVPYSWPRTSADGHRAIELREMPAGDELQLRDGRPACSRSRTINADGSANNTELTPYDRGPRHAGRSPRPTSRTRRAPTAIPRFAMALMLCYNQFAVTVAHGYDIEVLCHVFPHHLPERHGRRHGTQGGPEGRHLRDRRPAELLGDRQPGERRELQLLQDSL